MKSQEKVEAEMVKSPYSAPQTLAFFEERARFARNRARPRNWFHRLLQVIAIAVLDEYELRQLLRGRK